MASHHPIIDDDLGPIAMEWPHLVKFGKVKDENRGINPMEPPIDHIDPWFWLRDDNRANPEVIAHLTKESEFFEKKTVDLKESSNTIYNEHISHTLETDMSDPYIHGPFYYYSRTVKDLSYIIYCRVPQGSKPGSEKEEIIIDVNKIAEGKKHCDVRAVAPSPDHKMFLYSIDVTGNEVFDLKSVNEGEMEEVISGTNGSVHWCADVSCFIYCTKDEALRDNRVWLHRMGTKQSEDLLLYEENNEIFGVYMSRTMDGKHILMGSSSPETSEEYLINFKDLKNVKNIKNGNDIPKLLIRKREKGIRYHTCPHEDDHLLIITNADGCKNNKIILAHKSNPDDWSKILIKHNPDMLFDEMIVFKKYAVIGGRMNGLSQIWTMLLEEVENSLRNCGELKGINSQDPVYYLELCGYQNCEYEALTFRIKYSSLTKPDFWSDFSPWTHISKIVKHREVGGGFDSKNYKCERRFVTAPDGTEIAMSIVYRHNLVDLSKKQPYPTLLYGYGSYGICIDPSFSISYLPYLDRGMVYVIAHIRGGGENGRAWYEVQAKYLTKRNTFQDFISCAEYLIESGITTPAQFACEGRSAGGLLIGAVLNMRPDLFKAAIAGVPFVDVMTTMCDASIPLTTGEWEEWGNPNEHKYYSYMKSYSPMDNVISQNYPNLLIVAGLYDPRVAYWEPAKWACKLRKLKQNTNHSEILLKIDMNSGHFSASDRYKYLREKAIEQAWIIKHLLAS